VCHVCDGMRHCHGNNIFAVDVINKVVYNNDIKTVAQDLEQYSALNATT